MQIKVNFKNNTKKNCLDKEWNFWSILEETLKSKRKSLSRLFSKKIEEMKKITKEMIGYTISTLNFRERQVPLLEIILLSLLWEWIPRHYSL